MKTKRTVTKTKKKIDWDEVCERTRQRCNKLSDEENERLLQEGLRIIYGSAPKQRNHRP
jgi:hypothetical protein